MNKFVKFVAAWAAVWCVSGAVAAFGYETPVGARYPYVSTYYVEPVVSPASNTVVKFFVTDWENSLERFGDGSLRFDAHLRYSTNRVDWTELSLADIPSGDHAIALGQLPRGDYVFGLKVVDRQSGLSSHTVWHEFRSRTDEERILPADRVYTMTEADLKTYGIVPETNRYRYVEVAIDSAMASDETARQNHLKEVAQTAEVPSGTYAIFSPVYDGKPVLRAFRSMSCKYADDYDFAAVEREASNNVVAIQRLMDEVAAAGYRRLVFLPGKYRLSYHASLEMRSGLDVDLNGAVWKGNGFTGASGCLVNFTHVHDGALRNGTIEGDYYEHDYAGSSDNSEWALGVCLHGDCRYVTLDGLVVSNITGYGVSNGTRAYDHTFPGSASFSGKGRYSPGCLSLADGTVDPAATNRFTSDFRDISKLTNGYVTVSKYLGYQGIATKSWNYVACFYDADKAFLSGEVAFQYREVLIPPGAKYMRISVEEETAEAADGCSMSAQLFKRPWNCAFRNLSIYRCRCVGMAQSAMRNMLVENCEFSFSGESSATCAYDAEDGWDMMQDVFIRDNYFHDNWNAELLTCAGHNFVMERNRAKLHLYARTNSPCVRDNVCSSATFECGTRNRTMHGRYHGNRIAKSLTFGNNSTERDWFINYSEPIGPETSTADAPYPFGLGVSRTGRFRGATVRNAKMQPGVTCFEQTVFTNCHLVLSGTADGNWTDCTFRNCYWQYSKTNVFTRCVFTDGTRVSGMTGRGHTTMTDCVFTNFYLGSGYWTTPYDLTMKRCSVKNDITSPFWSVGVYSVGSFSIEDCRFETDGVAPFHLFDLRPQGTDGEDARIAISESATASGVFISKNEGGQKTTAKNVAFLSLMNTVADEPVKTAEAFMCKLLPGLWTCNVLFTPEVSGVSSAGVDYNGSSVVFDFADLVYGSPCVFGDLGASLVVNGKTYAGEVTDAGDAHYRVSFDVDRSGGNAVVASNRYDACFSLWFEDREGGRTELATVGERLLQGVLAEGLGNWFTETPKASGAEGDWTLDAQPVRPATDAAAEHLVVETPAGVPLVYTPKREMPEDRRGVIETTMLFEEASEDDEDDRPPEDAQCAARIVEDEEGGYRLQVYASVPNGNGGVTAGWQDGNTAEAADFAFVKGTEYAVKFELDYRAEDLPTGTTDLACFVKPAGGEYVKLYAGTALRPTGEFANRRIRDFSLLGRGKIANLDGAYATEVIDANLASVGGVEHPTVASAVAAANGRPVTVLHAATWVPTAADLGREIAFVGRERLVMDLSGLPQGYVANWTQAGDVWTLVLESTEPVEIGAARIGVCSWSWRDTMTSVLVRMERNGVRGMQLALSPWVWEGTESDETLRTIRAKAQAGEIEIHSTMISFEDEDYSSLTAVSNTCGLFYGLAPSATDEQRAMSESKWQCRSNQFARAAILTGELGVPYLTAHLGLIGLDDAAAGYPRLWWACRTCRQNGCKLLIETGLYSAVETDALLEKLVAAHPDIKDSVGLNFDSANQILAGSDNPTQAFPILRKWIGQVHVKDCREDPAVRGGWAADVEWGLGDVSTKHDFIGLVRKAGFEGPLLVEHGSGAATADEQAKEVMTAVRALLTANNADDPSWATPDWINPTYMTGATEAERTQAALKAQGFDAASAAAVTDAGDGAYETVRTWAQAYADGWQARGAAHKPSPSEIAARPGVLASAAIGSDGLLDKADVKVASFAKGADGVTLSISLGDVDLSHANEELLKSAVGVEGAYALDGSASFDAANVNVKSKATAADAVEVEVSPRPMGGLAPRAFFFKARVR